MLDYLKMEFVKIFLVPVLARCSLPNLNDTIETLKRKKSFNDNSNNTKLNSNTDNKSKYDEQQFFGLLDNVEIRRDKYGIPHIYAKDLLDLVFAQGFVHAQDRYQQMEMSRRLSQGRLSELIGQKALDIDRFSKTMGQMRTAKQEYNLMLQRHKLSRFCTEDFKYTEFQILEAYTQGINRQLQHVSLLPVELNLLGCQSSESVEKQKPLDCLCLYRFLAYRMSFGWEHELVRMKLIEAVGVENARIQDIDDKLTPPIVPEKQISLLNTNFKISNGAAFGLTSNSCTGNSGIAGSNSQAIHASRTDTGSAILCNDPHLEFSLPNIMYENHLRQKPVPNSSNTLLNLYGVSICGLPFVMIGHNERIGWGITLGYADTQDIFVEKFLGKDSLYYEVASNNTNKEESKNDKSVLEAKQYVETIRVKSKKGKNAFEEEEFNVLETIHGTVLSPIFNSTNIDQIKSETKHSFADKEAQYDYRFCLATTLNDISPDSSFVTSLLLLAQSQNFEQFSKACHSLIGPSINLTYADTSGNIGYQMAGRVPMRSPIAINAGASNIPLPGWVSSKYDWNGYISPSAMPHIYNPIDSTGYIVSANQRPILNEVKENKHNYIGHIYRQGYRARSINQTLAKLSPNISIQDCCELQSSYFSFAAKDLLDLMRRHSNVDHLMSWVDTSVQSSLEKHSQVQLMLWDCNMTPDSIPATIYQVFFRFLLYELLNVVFKVASKNGDSSECVERKTFLRNILGLSLFPDANPIGNAYKCRIERSVFRMLENQNSQQIQQTEQKTYELLIESCFRRAVKYLCNRFGNNSDKQEQGLLHRLVLQHRFSLLLGSPSIQPFSRGPYPVGGDTTTVCCMALNNDILEELDVEQKTKNCAALLGNSDFFGCKGGAVFRMVLDMNDLDNGLAVLSGGQSSNMQSSHYNDQTESLYLKGKYRRMLQNDEEILRSTQNLIVLKPVSHPKIKKSMCGLNKVVVTSLSIGIIGVILMLQFRKF